MKHITLRVRVYGPLRKRLLRDLHNKIQTLFSQLDVQIIKLSTNRRGHLVVQLEGEDEEFAANVLFSEYGRAFHFEDILVGMTYHGHLIEVGHVGYGIYVNIGIISPSSIDVLIPLYQIREQMHTPNKSIRQIARQFVLVDNLPLTITVKAVDSVHLTIEGKLSASFLKQINYWMHDDHERLLVFGANRTMIELALQHANHLEDIYQIEALGPYEYVLVCKRRTHASGILSAIGPNLRGVPIHLFIPDKVRVMNK